MPQILEYTPAWLSRPSPGFKLFSSSEKKQLLGTADAKKEDEDYDGPHRVIAKRGTEVFVVVDNSIRWADLSALKETWEEGSENGTSPPGRDGEKIYYRVSNGRLVDRAHGYSYVSSGSASTVS